MAGQTTVWVYDEVSVCDRLIGIQSSRICVKVEVAGLGSPSIIVLMVSVDVKQL